MKTPAAISVLPGFAFAAHAVDVSVDDGGVKTPKDFIQLVPMGTVTGRDGRGPYRLDDVAHAQKVIDASMATAGGTEIPIDYDHQIPFGAKDGVGGQAPASGWIKSMVAQPDGIWAHVEWTPAAAQKIAAREYRYISPYFSHEKASGRVSRIWNAGLVNLPNFTELAAVAGANPTEERELMSLSAIAKALGLPDDATAEQVATAAAAAKTAADGAKDAIAAASANVDPRAFVPMALFEEVRGQVKTLTDNGADLAAANAVGDAVKAGKITPAGREHALKLYKADPEAFAAFTAAAPVLIAGETTTTAGAKIDEVAGALSAEEKAAASALGVSEEAFLASKKTMMGAN